MILNTTSDIKLYSCISFESRQFFKRKFYLKQTYAITGGPHGEEGPGQLPQFPPPLNPALAVAHMVRFALKSRMDVENPRYDLSYFVYLQSLAIPTLGVPH